MRSLEGVTTRFLSTLGGVSPLCTAATTSAICQLGIAEDPPAGDSTDVADGDATAAVVVLAAPGVPGVDAAAAAAAAVPVTAAAGDGDDDVVVVVVAAPDAVIAAAALSESSSVLSAAKCSVSLASCTAEWR